MFRHAFILFSLLVAALIASTTLHARDIVEHLPIICVEDSNASAAQKYVPVATSLAEDRADKHGQNGENHQQNEDAMAHQHACHGHYQSLAMSSQAMSGNLQQAALLWPLAASADYFDVVNPALRPPIA